MTTTMSAWELRGTGLDHLRLTTARRPPVPGPGQVLIRVRAVSLNYRDLAAVRGDYVGLPADFVPASDCAGEIAETGPGATQFRPGDRVVSVCHTQWLDGPWRPEYLDDPHAELGYGALAEYQLVAATNVAPTPAHLSDEEASTLPIAALTSWHALHEYGNLQAGDSVLIQGTGGVALFGAQFALAAGALVIVTSGDDRKLERVRTELGVTHTVNYRSDSEWVSTVTNLADGRGVDYVLDIAGGPGLNDSLRAVRAQGTVASIGWIGGQRSEIDLFLLQGKHIRLQGMATGCMRAFHDALAVIAARRIRPVIDSVHPFRDASAAFRRMAEGPFGKVVVSVPDLTRDDGHG